MNIRNRIFDVTHPTAGEIEALALELFDGRDAARKLADGKHHGDVWLRKSETLIQAYETLRTLASRLAAAERQQAADAEIDGIRQDELDRLIEVERVLTERLAAAEGERDAALKLKGDADRLWRALNGHQQGDAEKRAHWMMEQAIDGCNVGPGNRAGIETYIADHLETFRDNALAAIQAKMDALKDTLLAIDKLAYVGGAGFNKVCERVEQIGVLSTEALAVLPAPPQALTPDEGDAGCC